MLHTMSELVVDTEKKAGDTPEIEAGIYRHYQGGLYRVHGIAYDESTLTPLVVYESFYQSESEPRRSFWTRPYTEFSDLVRHAAGEVIPRFRRETAFDRWFL